MKCVKRNKSVIYYSRFLGKEECVDEEGNYTGEYEVKYSEPKPIHCVVSANEGTKTTEQYGNYEDYDNLLRVDDKRCEINEESAIWMEKAPLLYVGEKAITGSENVILKNKRNEDAVVKRVSKTKNTNSYQIQKVKIGK